MLLKETGFAIFYIFFTRPSDAKNEMVSESVQMLLVGLLLT